MAQSVITQVTRDADSYAPCPPPESIQERGMYVCCIALIILIQEPFSTLGGNCGGGIEGGGGGGGGDVVRETNAVCGEFFKRVCLLAPILHVRVCLEVVFS